MTAPAEYSPHPPIILTLELNAPEQAWAQSMRARYFPAEKNHVPAHITLFHAVPNRFLQIICAHLAQQRPAPLVEIGAPFLLGRGVAYRVVAPDVALIRQELVSLIGTEHFTLQDQAKWRPHFTVQNKVLPDQAKALFRQLLTEHQSRKTFGATLSLWHYLNGPWALIKRMPFLAPVL